MTVTDWGPWRFLLGDWRSSGASELGESHGGFTFRMELGEHVLVRRVSQTYVPSNGRPTIGHEDMLVIHRDGDRWRAVYWDAEGHRIDYTVAIEPGRAVFSSEPGPGPRFRLSYEAVGDRAVDVAFAIAPPGSELATHVSGRAERTR